MEESFRVRKGTFQFADGLLQEDRQGDYYYSDSYFRRNATILNPHLRTLSYAFCMTCFPSVKARREAGSYERVYRYAEAFLKDNGFTDFEANADYKKEPAMDTLAVLAGHKVIMENGKPVSLIAVGLRGADYGDEWAANLILGEKGVAQGYEKGVETADQFLCGFMERLGDKICARVKYWITGYSRVGGVANLLGAKIDRNAKAYRTDTGDLFVYTFEAPAVAAKDDVRPFPSIHNTVSRHDLVPQMPPDSWGFRRYGNDDTVFPPIHSMDFQEKIGEVLKRVNDLNPEIHYNATGFFTTYLRKGKIRKVADYEDAGGYRPDEWWYHAKQDEFLERFMEFMSKKIAHPEDGADPTDAERRTRFAVTYQKAFSELAKSYLGVTNEKKEILRQELHRLASEDMTKARKAYIVWQLYKNREFAYRRVERYITGLLQKRLLSEPKLGLTKEELRGFFKGIERSVYYFVKCASFDMRRHRLAYLSTLISNLDQIVMAHMPEVIFAWLMTLDTYYHKDMSLYLQEAEDVST